MVLHACDFAHATGESDMQHRHRVGKAVICGLALLAGSAFAFDKEKSAGDCFKAGFESNNADTVAACYAQDAIIWFPGGPKAEGRAAIRDGFAHFLSEYTVKSVQMTTIGQQDVDDLRLAWGTYTISGVEKATGKAFTQNGRYTDMQKKIDGRWLYVVDHPSDDPPAAPPKPAIPAKPAK